MHKRVLLRQLRRVPVTGFLVLAIALNICELPVRGHAHVAESPVTDPGSQGHGDAHVSACEGSALKPSAPPEAIPDATGAPVENHIAPIPPPVGRPPAPATSSLLYRPPLFLLHAALLI
jgi:hypothetical protein